MRVVGDLDGVVVVVERDDGQDRPEDLFLRDLAVRVHVCEQGGLVEAARIHLLAAGDEGRALVDGALDHAVDLVALLLADDRAHVDLRVRRITERHVLHDAGDVRDDLVVLRPRHEQAGGERTALSRVRADAEGRELGGGGDVRVVEHDECRLAAEFEEDPLEGVGCRRHDLLADRRRAGEGDHVDVRVGGHQFAGRDLRRRQDVDDAGGDVGVVGDELGERLRDAAGCRVRP